MGLALKGSKDVAEDYSDLFIFKLGKMIWKIPVQCNMVEISSNKIPQNLKSNLIVLKTFLKTFFGGLKCGGKGVFWRGAFTLRKKARLAEFKVLEGSTSNNNKPNF